MSKQDGAAPRTAADLERKYSFGQTFAEVYGLANDAQDAADEAREAADAANAAIANLDQEQIFNLLTNNGVIKGLFKDANGNLYFNADFINSGKLKAEYIDAANLKVLAANVDGKLVANQIDASELKVDGANITGKLTADKIDATELKVDGANITGTVSGAKFVSKGSESWKDVTIGDAKVSFGSGSIYDGRSGVVYFDAESLRFAASNVDFVMHEDASNPANTRILRINGSSGLSVIDGYGNSKESFTLLNNIVNAIIDRVNEIESFLSSWGFG